MKKVFTLLPIMLSVLLSFAQGTSGKIKYTQTTKFDFSLDGEASQFAEAFPKEAKSERELYFSPSASSWQSAKSKEVAEDVNNLEQVISIVTGDNDDKIYNDIKTGQRLEQREFMSRVFLITSDIKKQDWKITGNQKQLLGYPCIEATTVKDSTEITAWFTAAIPVSVGPAFLNGLPGVILEASLGKHVTYTANNITLGDVAADIKKPKEGKKVSQKEFDEIMDEKIKEMKANSSVTEGPGGIQMMIIK